MKLKEFSNSQLRYDISKISEDAELSQDVKEYLEAVGMLDSASSGDSENAFGEVTIAALSRFQHDYDCHEPDFLGPETASKLLEISSSGSRSAAKPLVIRTLKETLFKQTPFGEEIKTVGAPKAKELDVIFYEEVRGYLRLTLRYPLEGMKVWYVWGEDLEVVADDPSGGDVVHPHKVSSAVKLDVPYKSQLDNLEHPCGSCNVTCLAMCMEFVKPSLKPSDGSQLEDNLFRYAINNGLSRHSPYDLAKIAESNGVRDRFDKDATIKKVQTWLSEGKPAVTHGYFTNFGHIITLVGYDDKGFVVHDPNGEWFSSGYDRNQPSGNNEKGKFKHYSYNLIKSKCIEEGNSEGRFWVHFISAR